MAVQRQDTPLQPQLSQAEYQRINQAQAAERVRRGFVGYTRKEHGEFMNGSTSGESRLSQGTRGTQVGYRTRK